MLEIHQLSVLSDNYVYLVRDSVTGQTGAVDPAMAEPVLAALKRLDWTLSFIINTHHHPDHVGGNDALVRETGCQVVGPRADAARIPGITLEVGDGDEFALGEAKAQVFDVPGHTRGHIAYWFRDAAALFCGDTLFALGCGRLFEGTPAQMWHSLSKLKVLPPETRIYCAHEYTQSNGRFALSVEPANSRLVARMQRVDELRAAGQPTVPSTLEEEMATNPFLRPDSLEIQHTLGLPGAALVDVFGATRALKDNFRS